MDLSELRVGQPIHGAIGEVTLSGFVVDFQRHRGFLPHHELDDGQRLTLWDEVDAWIAELDPHLGWVRLTSRPLRPQRTVIEEPWHGFRPDLTPPGRPEVRMGEGVAFFELYMRRRSKRSWSRG